jgi:pseudaminic acid cytidylyltransferase
MRLAVIPARGGSKRIPRKNILPFAGKPVIAYPIQAASECGLFDRIIVSTDDEEIAEVGRAFGAETPFRRPADLADDLTPTVPVIAHAIRACADLGWQADEICCIYPAVPLIDPDDLIRAHRLFQEAIAPYVFPVTRFPSPIQRALRRDDSGRVAPFQPEFVHGRTQDLEPAYFDSGQFYWGLADAWLEGLSVHEHGATIVLPEWRAIDIDTPDDWRQAEILFEALRQRA